jgi:endonuclease/exonuclease/phosphatase family metal-dependent hydrolase
MPPPGNPEPNGRRLRLLNYNIQSGLSTSRYSQYVTKSWRHVVPVPQRMENLDLIADLISRYDVVGLQEVDVGSLRSGFVNQARYLAEAAGFRHFQEQTNRRVGRISQHSNVVMSRLAPVEIRDYKLPGMIPGRGALMVRFGDATSTERALFLLIVHLALGKRARYQQLAYLGDLLARYPYVVMMGDLNTPSDSRELMMFRESAGMGEPAPGLQTFPSWKPNRQLDHILVSKALEVQAVQVLEHRYSDHLPIALDILVPPDVPVDGDGESPPPRQRSGSD